MRQKKLISIDKLLDYWIDISKRPILTPEDYALFLKMIETSMKYFAEFYGWYRSKHVGASRDKFFRSLNTTLWLLQQDELRKPASESMQLSRNKYAQMKDFAKKFIPRIKKCFGQDIVSAINTKTPLQDAETLLAYSTKLTYRWAAGIVVSNHLVNLLIQLSHFRPNERYEDDIMMLYAKLKNRVTNRKLKTFFVRGYRRFEDAHKVRNRCAHVTHGEPTKQEIEQSIALARLLQKYASRS
jgi:hypothetical protein